MIYMRSGHLQSMEYKAWERSVDGNKILPKKRGKVQKFDFCGTNKNVLLFLHSNASIDPVFNPFVWIFKEEKQRYLANQHLVLFQYSKISSYFTERWWDI